VYYSGLILKEWQNFSIFCYPVHSGLTGQEKITIGIKMSKMTCRYAKKII